MAKMKHKLFILAGHGGADGRYFLLGKKTPLLQQSDPAS